jgi:hypothetical protein
MTGTPTSDPDRSGGRKRIDERYWDVAQTDGQWQAEFRFTGE